MIKKLLFVFFLFPILVNLYAQTGSIDEKQQGYVEKYDDKGSLKYKGTFKDGAPIDTFYYYFPGNLLKAISFFYEHGEAGTSHTTLYRKDGSIYSKGFYKDYKKDSLWSYYRNDSVFAAKECYKNSMKHGTWSTYFMNGLLFEEINWSNDVKNGTWTQYYDNGSICLKAIYVNGKLNGTFTYYHDVEKVLKTGEYLNGLKTGIWLSLSPKGIAINKNTYYLGVLVKEQKYEDGKMIEENIIIKDLKDIDRIKSNRKKDVKDVK